MRKIKLLKTQIALCAETLEQDYQQCSQTKALALQEFNYGIKSLYPWLSLAAFIAGFTCAISPKFRRTLVATIKHSSTTLLSNKVLLEYLVAALTLK